MILQSFKGTQGRLKLHFSSYIPISFHFVEPFRELMQNTASVGSTGRRGAGQTESIPYGTRSGEQLALPRNNGRMQGRSRAHKGWQSS